MDKYTNEISNILGSSNTPEGNMSKQIFDNLIKDIKSKAENDKGGAKKSKNEIINNLANDQNIMMQIKNIGDLMKK